MGEAGVSMSDYWRVLGRLVPLLSWSNIQKAGRQLWRGNPDVVMSSIRRLLSQREALEAAAGAAGIQYDPDALFDPLQHPETVPLVTVVIPCFNYGAYVKEAVDSALAQTFKDIRVVVIDGGSTDGLTPDVVRSLAGPQVDVVLRDGRHLVGDNRNHGISLTRSPYIVCLDADDTLQPTFIEKALFLCEHAGFDVVSTALNVFGARPAGYVGLMQRPALDDLIAGNHVYTCALFRRRLWENVGGYHDYGLGAEHVAEDWDFWVRAAAQGARFCNIAGEALLNYRTHATQSLSSASDVPGVETQRQRILDRNAALLSSRAFARSRSIATTDIFVRSPMTGLVRGMRAYDQTVSGTILIAIPFFLVGGAERLLCRMVQELVADGWRVIVISTVDQPRDDSDAIAWFQATTAEVYALPRFIHPKYWIKFLEYMLSSRDIDVLLLAGSRFIYDMLDQIHAQNPSLKIVDLLFNTVGHTKPHLLHKDHFAGVLCENAEVRDWLLAQGWEPERLALVESRVDVPGYRTDRCAELAGSLGIDDDDVVVGFSGRLSEEKAPEIFVEIARLCRQDRRIKFVMTGTGRLKDEIERLIAKLPEDVQLQYLGVVQDVVPYFGLYDICVIPSYIDGRPQAALEALASGCVLVASRVGGLPSLIREGEHGFLLPPGSAESFAGCILALAADRERLDRMKRAARQFAEGNLDTASTGPLYVSGLRRLAGMQPQG
jgi:glycosyltransferase involved in cell wall biosynthesis